MLGSLTRLHRGEHDKHFALGDTAGRSAARVLLNILVARLAGVDGYSLLVLLLSVEVVWTTLCGAWIVTPMLNLGAGLPRAERDGLGRRALQRVVRWTVMVVPSGVALALWASARSWLDADVGVILGFAVSLSLQGPLAALRGWRGMGFESWHAFWADALAQALPLGGLLLAAVMQGGGWALAAYWWMTALGSAVACVMMLWCDRARWRTAKRPDETMEQRWRRQGRPMVLGSLAYSVGARLHPMILVAAASTLEVARFGAAATLVGPLRMLGMALGGVIRPRLALAYQNGDPGAVHRLLRRVGGALMLSVVALGVLALLLGEWVAPALFGDWLTQVRWLLVLACGYGGVACAASFMVTAMQTQSDGGAAVVARYRLVASLASLAIAWPACIFGGAAGAMAALLAIEALFFIALARVWWRAESSPLD